LFAGIYLSPLLPLCDDTAQQPSEHRDYLLKYLRAYGVNVIPQRWMNVIQRSDWTNVKVLIVN
jgi:hypothetical protein